MLSIISSSSFIRQQFLPFEHFGPQKLISSSFPFLFSDASQCKAVEFRVDTIGPAGEHYRHLWPLQYGRRLRFAEERNGLVEYVTGLDIGKDESVGTPLQWRLDAFLM